jgi:hypothetical protein
LRGEFESIFFVVMNGGSAIKRDLKLYAPSVYARPVSRTPLPQVIVLFSYSMNSLAASAFKKGSGRYISEKTPCYWDRWLELALVYCAFVGGALIIS